HQARSLPARGDGCGWTFLEGESGSFAALRPQWPHRREGTQGPASGSRGHAVTSHAEILPLNRLRAPWGSQPIPFSVKVSSLLSAGGCKARAISAQSFMTAAD